MIAHKLILPAIGVGIIVWAQWPMLKRRIIGEHDGNVPRPRIESAPILPPVDDLNTKRLLLEAGVNMIAEAKFMHKDKVIRRARLRNADSEAVLVFENEARRRKRFTDHPAYMNLRQYFVGELPDGSIEVKSEWVLSQIERLRTKWFDADQLDVFYARVVDWWRISETSSFAEVDKYLESQTDYQRVSEFMSKSEGGIRLWGAIGEPGIHPRLSELKRAIEQYKKKVGVL